MAEKKIENHFCSLVKAKGGLAFKWVSPGTAGVMDRIALMPIPPEHREIVNRYVKLVELKDANKKPDPLQQRVAGWIRELGFEVHCSDSQKKNTELVG
jgi:hypothetical protein